MSTYNGSTNAITINLPQSSVPTWYLDCVGENGQQLYADYSNGQYSYPIDSIEVDCANGADVSGDIKIEIPQAGGQVGYKFDSAIPLKWNSGDETLQNDVTPSFNADYTVMTLGITDALIATSDSGSFCFNLVDANGNGIEVDPAFSIIRR